MRRIWILLFATSYIRNLLTCTELGKQVSSYKLRSDRLDEGMLTAVCVALTVQDAATAKSLAFHKEVHTRCVTLEGDDFNPSGTLTGAAPASLSQ